MIEIGGHALLRYISRPVIDKYIAESEEEYNHKRKKIMNDYLS